MKSRHNRTIARMKEQGLSSTFCPYVLRHTGLTRLGESGSDVFHLITTREDLSAELIGLIYRQRWQIELFFKWIKTILNCRHWLAESPAGVTIQIYCVLIASLLLLLWTGRRPNQRTVESLQLYWTGWATKQELVMLLQRANPKKS